jgi:hypothetical protein
MVGNNVSVANELSSTGLEGGKEGNNMPLVKGSRSAVV